MSATEKAINYIAWKHNKNSPKEMICCDKLTSSSPATSIHSIHLPIMTLLPLEKGQLARGWRHFRMKKAQSCEGKLNCNLTCAVDQHWLFIFRTNKRNKKKGKEKEAVTAHGGKLGSASYTESMRLMREGNVLLCLPNCITDISDLPLQAVKNISSKLSSTLLLTKSR